MVRRVLALGVVGIGIASLLTGCGPSGTVNVEAAANATDPACASVVLNLPEEMGSIDGMIEKRRTSSQGTGAWGSPSAVVLRCGVAEPGPTDATCSEIGGVDWINVGDEGDTMAYVSYGRSPAVEVTIDASRVTPIEALGRIAPALGNTEAYGGCVGLDELESP